MWCSLSLGSTEFCPAGMFLFCRECVPAHKALLSPEEEN